MANKDDRSIMKFLTDRVNFKAKTRPVKDYIKVFFTDNIDTLSSDGFSKRIVFGSVKRQSLIDIYGIDITEWNAFVKQHTILQIGENVKDIINELLIVHYIIEQDPILLKFLSVKIFTSKYYRSFPIYIKEAKMKAVIDGLSDKFYIKKHGTLDKAIDATVNTYVNTYKKRFLSGKDLDIIYVINALSTRIGILVRNVQVKYYNAPDDIGFFEDKEILEKDNKRSTTNDALMYDKIIDTVKSAELTYNFDLQTLRTIKGYDYKEVLREIYKNDRPIVTNIIKEVLYDYLRSNPDSTLKDTHDNFLKWSYANRKRGKVLISNLDILVSKYKIEKPDEFKDIMIKYYSIRLYMVILREIV